MATAKTALGKTRRGKNAPRKKASAGKPLSGETRANRSGATSGWEPVFRVVRRVPPGRVATYGQIAALAGMPGAARQVGWALNSLRGEAEAGSEIESVPWHRVINARGEISRRGEAFAEDLQRALLEAEGVEFSKKGRVDLSAAGWKPRARGPSRAHRAPEAGARRAPATSKPKTPAKAAVKKRNPK